MSTFTKLSKRALSSQWFLHPGNQGTSDPTITHVFTYALVGQSRIHRGDHIPVIFCPYMSLSSNKGLSICESTFLIYISVRMYVCLSGLIRISTSGCVTSILRNNQSAHAFLLLKS